MKFSLENSKFFEYKPSYVIFLYIGMQPTNRNHTIADADIHVSVMLWV